MSQKRPLPHLSTDRPACSGRASISSQTKQSQNNAVAGVSFLDATCIVNLNRCGAGISPCPSFRPPHWCLHQRYQPYLKGGPKASSVFNQSSPNRAGAQMKTPSNAKPLLRKQLSNKNHCSHNIAQLPGGCPAKRGSTNPQRLQPQFGDPHKQDLHHSELVLPQVSSQ